MWMHLDMCWVFVRSDPIVGTDRLIDLGQCPHCTLQVVVLVVDTPRGSCQAQVFFETYSARSLFGRGWISDRGRESGSVPQMMWKQMAR